MGKTWVMLDEKKNVKEPRGFIGTVENRAGTWYFLPDFKKNRPSNWDKIILTTWEREINNGRGRCKGRAQAGLPKDI